MWQLVCKFVVKINYKRIDDSGSGKQQKYTEKQKPMFFFDSLYFYFRWFFLSIIQLSCRCNTHTGTRVQSQVRAKTRRHYYGLIVLKTIQSVWQSECVRGLLKCSNRGNIQTTSYWALTAHFIEFSVNSTFEWNPNESKNSVANYFICALNSEDKEKFGKIHSFFCCCCWMCVSVVDLKNKAWWNRACDSPVECIMSYIWAWILIKTKNRSSNLTIIDIIIWIKWKCVSIVFAQNVIIPFAWCEQIDKIWLFCSP